MARPRRPRSRWCKAGRPRQREARAARRDCTTPPVLPTATRARFFPGEDRAQTGQPRKTKPRRILDTLFESPGLKFASDGRHRKSFSKRPVRADERLEAASEIACQRTSTGSTPTESRMKPSAHPIPPAGAAFAAEWVHRAEAGGLLQISGQRAREAAQRRTLHRPGSNPIRKPPFAIWPADNPRCDGSLAKPWKTQVQALQDARPDGSAMVRGRGAHPVKPDLQRFKAAVDEEGFERAEGNRSRHPPPVPDAGHQGGIAACDVAGQRTSEWPARSLGVGGDHQIGSQGPAGAAGKGGHRGVVGDHPRPGLPGRALATDWMSHHVEAGVGGGFQIDHRRAGEIGGCHSRVVGIVGDLDAERS